MAFLEPVKNSKKLYLSTKWDDSYFTDEVLHSHTVKPGPCFSINLDDLYTVADDQSFEALS